MAPSAKHLPAHLMYFTSWPANAEFRSMQAVMASRSLGFSRHSRVYATFCTVCHRQPTVALSNKASCFLTSRCSVVISWLMLPAYTGMDAGAGLNRCTRLLMPAGPPACSTAGWLSMPASFAHTPAPVCPSLPSLISAGRSRAKSLSSTSRNVAGRKIWITTLIPFLQPSSQVLPCFLQTFCEEDSDDDCQPF